jgi:4-hydroxyacetophenone monooxygenase
MQIVPTIVDEVGGLQVYQRSPQWARPFPEYHAKVEPGSQWLLENVPYYAAWNRLTLFWRFGDGLLKLLRRDPDWPDTGSSINRVNDRHRAEMTAHILSELDGRPDLVEKSLPHYPPYGKRILIDNGWYRTIRSPKVELITDAIDRVDATGIISADGTHRSTDIIVFATGFKVTDLTARLGVVGRGGVTLADEWADDNPTAYLGMAMPRFPNLFVMFGPNTNLAHGGSIIFHAECQARYIVRMLGVMSSLGISSVECTQAAHDDYVRRVDDAHAGLIWSHPAVDTWYRNRSGRVVAVSPWRLVDYWTMTHEPNLDDFVVTGEPTRASAAPGKQDVGRDDISDYNSPTMCAGGSA